MPTKIRAIAGKEAFLLVIGCVVVLAVACGQGTDSQTGEMTSAVRQAWSHAFTITLQAPNPMSPLTPVLLGSNAVILENNSIVNSGTVVAMGSGGLSAEGSILNDAWSRGSANIEDHSDVRGTLHAASVVLESGSVLAGADRTPGFDPPSTLSWTVNFPQGSALDVVLNTGQSQTLPPGRHGTVTVHSGATLTLTAGTYYLTGLDVHSLATVNLSQDAGPIIVYVTKILTLRTPFVPIGGGSPNLVVGYLGKRPVRPASQFNGALLAPFTTLTLPSVGSAHTGYFAARTVSLNPGGQVQYRFPAALAAAAANSGVARLEQATGVPWILTSRPPSGAFELTTYLRPKGDPGVPLPPGTKPQDPATAFLQKYADIFSLLNPATELALREAPTAPSG